MLKVLAWFKEHRKVVCAAATITAVIMALLITLVVLLSVYLALTLKGQFTFQTLQLFP